MYANDSAIKINNFPFHSEYGRYWGLYCGKRTRNGARKWKIWSCYLFYLDADERWIILGFQLTCSNSPVGSDII